MARRRRIDRDLRERRERKYKLQARTTRFIPDGDSDFAHMARQFANHVAKESHRFGIASEQVEKLSAAVSAYRDALYRATWSDEAGPKATRIKNTAREQAEDIVRAVGRTLRACESITSVDRLLLNMHERAENPKARECPQVAPVLKFIGGEGDRHVLEYGNDFDHSSSAKPHGAARLELFVELVPPPQMLPNMRRDIAMCDPTIAGQVPKHPAQWSGGRLWYLGSFTTSRFEVEYPVLNDGTPMLVCYWGRWADARGGVGPFSKTCVARVEGGAYALPEPMYIGNHRPALGSVSRKVEPREFPMLEAARAHQLVEARREVRQLEHAPA